MKRLPLAFVALVTPLTVATEPSPPSLNVGSIAAASEVVTQNVEAAGRLNLRSAATIDGRAGNLATTEALFQSSPSASILTYGGDPSGVSDNCAAKDAAIASFGSGAGVLLFPAGTYKFGCSINVSNRDVAIEGIGSGASKLRFTSGSSKQAGITISENNAAYQVGIRRLSIYSDVAQANGNSAISVTYPAAGGTGPKNVTFDDLEIGYGNTLTGYWAYGIKCSSCTNGYLANVNVHGKNEKNPPGGISASNTIAGVALDGYSSAFVMLALTVSFANYAVYASGDSEGSQQFACNFVGVNYGWYYDDGSAGDSTSIPQAPGPEITDCNTATYKGGFVSKGWVQTTITGGTVFYKRPESTSDWTGVSLLNGAFGSTRVGSNLNIISGGNQFYGFLGTPKTEGTATAVKLDTLASGNLVQGNSINYVTNAFDLSGGGGQNRLTDNQGYHFGKGWVAGGSASSAIVERNYPIVIGTDTATVQLPAGAAPAIGGANQKVFYTANTSATTVTNLTGGYAGEEIKIRGADGGKTRVTHDATIHLRRGVPATLADGDLIVLTNEGTYWDEVSRNF